MLAYVDDFSITVASESHRGNICYLQRTFTKLTDKGKHQRVSFSVLKTELRNWGTPSQRTPHATAPIELDSHLFHPQ